MYRTKDFLNDWEQFVSRQLKEEVALYDQGACDHQNQDYDKHNLVFCLDCGEDLTDYDKEPDEGEINV